MRVCLVYDCLYPWTVGGAERWYRALAERLPTRDHSVTYLTLRQWPRGETPPIAGVEVVPVGPPLPLYANGRRRIWPPLRFGLGVLTHLVRHGRRYDIVHCASFPYFAAIVAAAVQPIGRYRLVVDWWEVWSPAYWAGYLGRLSGIVGAGVQRLLARLPHRALCFSSLHAARLTAEGGPTATVVRGVYAGEVGRRLETTDGASEASTSRPRTDVVFVGRHVADKRVVAIPPALATAREAAPRLTASILGDGPERPRVEELVERLGVGGAIDLPGFVSEAELDRRLRAALCLLLPSRREGFGLAVLDAVSRGTPVLVVAGPDNAATDLVVPGVNGFVAPSAAPDDLAAGILAIEKAGDALRRSTSAWWETHRDRLSFETGFDDVLRVYADGQCRGDRDATASVPETATKHESLDHAARTVR